MSEAPTETSPSAWLLRAASVEAAPLFSQLLAIPPSLLRGVQSGDAVCVVSPDGNLAIGIARVFRTRAESGDTRIYFDGHSPIRPGRPLTEFGIDLSADRPISRLEWPKVEQVLKATLNVPFDSFPAFGGHTPHEQAYIRELLQIATIDDLLGPACGPRANASRRANWAMWARLPLRRCFENTPENKAFSSFDLILTL